MGKPPKQKRGKSKQDYETPYEFIQAVQQRFGELEVDLAADKDNAQALEYIDKATNALTIDWYIRFGQRSCWLNPPFGNIAPWAAKCAKYADKVRTGRIYFLVPASIGSNWFAKYVWGKAYVLALQGRLTFVGQPTPYPKDCLLAIYGARLRGFEVWKWRDGSN